MSLKAPLNAMTFFDRLMVEKESVLHKGGDAMGFRSVGGPAGTNMTSTMDRPDTPRQGIGLVGIFVLVVVILFCVLICCCWCCFYCCCPQCCPACCFCKKKDKVLAR